MGRENKLDCLVYGLSNAKQDNGIYPDGGTGGNQTLRSNCKILGHVNLNCLRDL